ncbi:MAG: DUF1015 domain-containing protein, partial [Bacteroidota bacterium]
MAKIKAFKGWRPKAELAAKVASRPYDVLNTEEARNEAEGNPHSFLHVVKPEIDLPPEHDPYSLAVYRLARSNFQQLVEEGVFQRDEEAYLYLYRLTWQGQSQTGLVAAAATEDYFNGTIKLHELTRPDKEEDRKNHLRYSGIIAEPVFFSYPQVAAIDELVARAQEEKPAYDFVAQDGVQHQIWVIRSPKVIEDLVSLFERQVPHTYVADGHHRTAAASLISREWEPHQANEATQSFMAVHFPDNQLRIIDYNRVVTDLNGLSQAEFLSQLEKAFQLNPQPKAYQPREHKRFGLYLADQWYELIARPELTHAEDPVEALDVSFLTKHILEPILGISDLRR